MADDPVICVEGLTVSYGDRRAVDGLDLEVARGSMLGLLGPNGAGKTTTIHCMAGLREPEAGSIRVDGVDVRHSPNEAQALLGVVPQALALYDTLTVKQNLRIFGGLFGVGGKRLRDRVDWALTLAQLESRAEAVVQTLSGGMKRRLNLVAALLHDPPILICDEPTTGVDPQSRNHLFDTIRELNDEGRTIVYTTHYMEEVEALCDEVAIVDHGKVIARDTLEALRATEAPRRFEVALGDDLDEAELREMVAGRAQVAPVASARSLEQVFLELTGRDLRDGG